MSYPNIKITDRIVVILPDLLMDWPAITEAKKLEQVYPDFRVDVISQSQKSGYFDGSLRG